MESHNYNVYKNIMSINPVIDKDYLGHILNISKTQTINNIEITKVIESNTALVIKATIQINDVGGTNTKKLFIKTIKCNEPENVYLGMSMKEGKFYEIIRNNAINNVPVPVCYDVFISEETKEFVLVLEDISDSYIVPDNTIISDKNIWFFCAESLAQFHSALWNNTIIPKNDKEVEHDFQSEINNFQSFLNDFRQEFDDKTKKALKRAMELNISLSKDHRQRIYNKSNITICNGDSHIYNFMLPLGMKNKPLIVDFQFWGEGIGTDDLAHLTRVSFSDDFKRNIQFSLVEHYHKFLLTNGVVGYTKENCLRDYRMSAATMVLIPYWQYSGFGIKYDEWIGDLQGLVYNYEFLKCNEL